MADITKKVQNWATGSGVLGASDPVTEYNISESYAQIQNAVFDVVAELTSSSPYSASFLRTPFVSLTRADYPAAMRVNDGIWSSSLNAGSTLVHTDKASGSFVCISGSFYNIHSSSAHGLTHNARFALLEDAFEDKLNFRIATAKGVTAAKAEASASYTGSINAIKALP